MSWAKHVVAVTETVTYFHEVQLEGPIWEMREQATRFVKEQHAAGIRPEPVEHDLADHDRTETRVRWVYGQTLGVDASTTIRPLGGKRGGETTQRAV